MSHRAKLARAKGRNSGGGSFLKIPHAYLQSPQWALLSPRAVKLLLDVAGQYNGRNNGDLTIVRSLMLPLGWTSNDQLYKAAKELLERGWFLMTRQGGRDRSMPTLYAVTWWGIDPCDGKLDHGIVPSPTALNLWKYQSPPESISLPAQVLIRRADCTAPPHGLIEPEKGRKLAAIAP